MLGGSPAARRARLALGVTVLGMLAVAALAGVTPAQSTSPPPGAAAEARTAPDRASRAGVRQPSTRVEPRRSEAPAPTAAGQAEAPKAAAQKAAAQQAAAQKAAAQQAAAQQAAAQQAAAQQAAAQRAAAQQAAARKAAARKAAARKAAARKAGAAQAARAKPVAGLTQTQMDNAARIVAVGRRLGLPKRAYVLAVACAMQESTLRNLASRRLPESFRYPHEGSGSDHDSVGLFQQRPSSGWGSVRNLMKPAYSSTRFYQALVRVPGWQRMQLTYAIQAVQVSAYPRAYAKHEWRARAVVEALT